MCSIYNWQAVAAYKAYTLYWKPVYIHICAYEIWIELKLELITVDIRVDILLIVIVLSLANVTLSAVNMSWRSDSSRGSQENIRQQMSEQRNATEHLPNKKDPDIRVQEYSNPSSNDIIISSLADVILAKWLSLGTESMNMVVWIWYTKKPINKTMHLLHTACQLLLFQQPLLFQHIACQSLLFSIFNFYCVHMHDIDSEGRKLWGVLSFVCIAKGCAQSELKEASQGSLVQLWGGALSYICCRLSFCRCFYCET